MGKRDILIFYACLQMAKRNKEEFLEYFNKDEEEEVLRELDDFLLGYYRLYKDMDSPE